MFNALDPDGEVYRKCRLTILGNPADVVLYSRELNNRWSVIDRLTKAKITERDDGSLTVEGTSQELVTIVGVAPAEAIVRWEVKPRGCATCH